MRAGNLVTSQAHLYVMRHIRSGCAASASMGRVDSRGRNPSMTTASQTRDLQLLSTKASCQVTAPGTQGGGGEVQW